MKIEAAKRYVTRIGWVTSPVKHTGDADFPWRDQSDSYSWTDSGLEWGDDESAMDLVAEYVEPTLGATEPSRLEIAARITAAMSTPFFCPTTGPNLVEAADATVAEALRRADILIAAERATRA